MTDNPKSTFARRVRAARPRARKYDGWDGVISGLGLRVGTSGHRSFFLRRTVRGRIRSATIGSADDMTLPEARAEARKLIASFVEPARKGNGRRGPSVGHPTTAFFAFAQMYLFNPPLGPMPTQCRVVLALSSRAYPEGDIEKKLSAITDRI